MRTTDWYIGKKVTVKYNNDAPLTKGSIYIIKELYIPHDDPNCLEILFEKDDKGRGTFWSFDVDKLNKYFIFEPDIDTLTTAIIVELNKLEQKYEK